MKNIYEDEQDPSSWIAADKDIVLTPLPPFTVEDAIKALENKDNYGIYLANIRTGKVTDKDLEAYFGPTHRATKMKLEKERGEPFPIRTKQAMDDFVKNRVGKPNLVTYKVVGDTLVFPNSKNLSKGRTQSVVSTVMDNAKIKYTLKQKESFNENRIKAAIRESLTKRRLK